MIVTGLDWAGATGAGNSSERSLCLNLLGGIDDAKLSADFIEDLLK